jgi:hypothetical protein
MRVIQSQCHEGEGGFTVSLLFKAKDQLLDPNDPSPPSRQELTEEAETVIITSFDAIPLKKPVALEIRLPDTHNPGSPASIPDAIRHHFRYLRDEHEKEWGIFLRQRRASLAFAVFNVLIAVLYVAILSRNESLITTLPGIIIGAIIVIMNWATVWDTYEFFIFDGLERRHRKKLLIKIIGADIRVNPVP